MQLLNLLLDCRLMERVQELEASEARVRELEADALLRTMDGPLDGDASFSSTSSREAYEPPFDPNWVRASTSDSGSQPDFT